MFLQLNQLFCLSAAKMTDSSLLNSELELQQQEELYQQLLSQVIVPEHLEPLLMLKLDILGLGCVFFTYFVLFSHNGSCSDMSEFNLNSFQNALEMNDQNGCRIAVEVQCYLSLPSEQIKQNNGVISEIGKFKFDIVHSCFLFFGPDFFFRNEHHLLAM